MQSFIMSLDHPGAYILYAKQHDTASRWFKAVLTCGGVAYQPPENAVYSVHYGHGNLPAGAYTTITAPDGTQRAAVCADGHTLVVELDSRMLAAPGENRLCLVITADGYRLASWNIRVLIQPDPLDGAEI